MSNNLLKKFLSLTFYPETHFTGFVSFSMDVKILLNNLDSRGGMDHNFSPLFFKMFSILVAKLKFFFRQSTFPNERKLCLILSTCYLLIEVTTGLFLYFLCSPKFLENCKFCLCIGVFSQMVRL